MAPHTHSAIAPHTVAHLSLLPPLRYKTAQGNDYFFDPETEMVHYLSDDGKANYAIDALNNRTFTYDTLRELRHLIMEADAGRLREQDLQEGAAAAAAAAAAGGGGGGGGGGGAGATSSTHGGERGASGLVDQRV